MPKGRREGRDGGADMEGGSIVLVMYCTVLCFRGGRDGEGEAGWMAVVHIGRKAVCRLHERRSVMQT